MNMSTDRGNVGSIMVSWYRKVYCVRTLGTTMRRGSGDMIPLGVRSDALMHYAAILDAVYPVRSESGYSKLCGSITK
jgi:hypothetical protein